jgi:protein-tyrosine-phosphatase
MPARCLRAICATLSIIAAVSVHRAQAENDGPAASVPTVVFICEHGSSRSFVAASLFNRIAEQRGLAVRALSRAVRPETADKKVIPRLAESMTRDGFAAASTFEPRPVTTSEATNARRIVVINYAGKVDAIGEHPAEHWDGVPAASLEYDRAKELITSHIEELLRALPAAAGNAAGSVGKP